MFGALNRFISRLDADPKSQQSQTKNAFGFQVLRNSTEENAIEPWFDFIIGINGHNIDNPDPSLFATEVRNCKGSNIELGLWSAKGARVRPLWVQVPANTASIGLSLQWMPLSTTEDVWHILDVAPNSPADLAGLLPYGDYIIGSPEGLLKGESAFGELVEDYLEQPLRVYVYNQEYNVTRLVTIEPTRSWGGQGALGCTLGFGALHRIPASLEEPPQAPGETMFEANRVSMDVARPASGLSEEPARSDTATPQYLVPADMNLGAPGPALDAAGPSKTPTATGRRKHKARGPALDMDAYFQEGEEKSREQDRPSSTKPSAAVPPPPPPKPPKAGEAEPEISSLSGDVDGGGNAGAAGEVEAAEDAAS